MVQREIRNVVVSTDLSEASVAPLRYARLVADNFGANLTVTFADVTAYPVDMFADSPVVFAAAVDEEHEKLRREIGTRVREWLGGRPYEVVVVTGQPSTMILRVAQMRDADLIVMGTHGRRGWRRALLGSVAEAVLHATAVPVLTVGPRMKEQTPAITRIVCPVNFTDVARDALRFATRLANAFAAELVVVHAIEEESRSRLVADEERMHHEARVRNWIDAGTQGLCSYRELVLRGSAAARVLDCVDDLEADLLVIGAQHKLFRDATVVGTTTERLVRFAECPVLTIAHSAVTTEEPVLAGAGTAVAE
jgi:nucleotide-binding universal stress UspA family protein